MLWSRYVIMILVIIFCICTTLSCFFHNIWIMLLLNYPAIYINHYLFSRQSYDWVLSVDLPLGQSLHDQSHRVVRAQEYDAESFGLSISPVLEELHIYEVRDADVGDCVRYILIRGPLWISLKIAAQLNARVKESTQSFR